MAVLGQGHPAPQVLYKIEFLALLSAWLAHAHRFFIAPARMPAPSAQEFLIQGVTSDGRAFRPSDWADRLAGVMSQFRPGGAQPGSHLSYSPWCVPTVINGVKCVIVHPDLRQAEPMAWDFVMGFARDNDLQVTQACLLPDTRP
jgi:hypothetical protein